MNERKYGEHYRAEDLSDETLSFLTLLAHKEHPEDERVKNWFKRFNERNFNLSHDLVKFLNKLILSQLTQWQPYKPKNPEESDQGLRKSERESLERESFLRKLEKAWKELQNLPLNYFVELPEEEFAELGNKVRESETQLFQQLGYSEDAMVNKYGHIEEGGGEQGAKDFAWQAFYETIEMLEEEISGEENSRSQDSRDNFVLRFARYAQVELGEFLDKHKEYLNLKIAYERQLGIRGENNHLEYYQKRLFELEKFLSKGVKEIKSKIDLLKKDLLKKLETSN